MTSMLQPGFVTSGRANLPSGAARKASQRRSHRAAHVPTAIAPTPIWRPGDTVRWKDHTGQFLREADDNQVEVLIGGRTYRVRWAEARSA